MLPSPLAGQGRGGGAHRNLHKTAMWDKLLFAEKHHKGPRQRLAKARFFVVLPARDLLRCYTLYVTLPLSAHSSHPERSVTMRQMSYLMEDICDTVLVGQGATWCATHGEYVHICIWCGVTFHSHRPHTKTCSNACRMADYRNRKKLRNECAPV